MEGGSRMKRPSRVRNSGINNTTCTKDGTGISTCIRTSIFLPLLIIVAADSVATSAFVPQQRQSGTIPSFVLGTRGRGHKRDTLTKKSAADPGGVDNSDWDLKSANGHSKRDLNTYSGRYVNDNGLEIVTDEKGRVTARPVAAAVIDKEDEGRENSSSNGDEKDKPAVVDSEDESASKVVSKRTKAVVQEEKLIKSETEEVKVVASSAVEVVEIPDLKPLKKAEDEEDSASSGKPKIVIRGNKPKPLTPKKQLKEHPVQTTAPTGGFNVVLTHCTADFDSLASAVGLAKLWSGEGTPVDAKENSPGDDAYKSSSNVPTFVVLPRGAHPGVQKFLALHKHLFPIRSLKSLPSDLSTLNRLGLVDAQRRDRLGPAEHLLSYAKRVTIVDHVSIAMFSVTAEWDLERIML